MEDTLLLQKHADGIAELVLNKPQRRNALDPGMMDRLAKYLEALDADNGVKVIILKGQGDHFCAGGDLKAGAGKTLTIEDSRNSLRKYGRVVQALQQMEKPVIAMVRGYAVGGGMSLALACDIILAADDAKFSANFLKVGIVPEMGAMLFLPQTIGLYRAKELWFTGRVVEATEASAMGWVNHVYPAGEVEQETRALAQTVAQMPAVPLRITKRITNSHINSMLNAVLEAELQASPLCSQTEEFKLYKAALMNK
jgi:Enoyl-CoA hydratase/carnithine racemase